jgi:hypothetical protein
MYEKLLVRKRTKIIKDKILEERKKEARPWLITLYSMVVLSSMVFSVGAYFIWKFIMDNRILGSSKSINIILGIIFTVVGLLLYFGIKYLLAKKIQIIYDTYNPDDFGNWPDFQQFVQQWAKKEQFAPTSNSDENAVGDF